MTPTLSLVLMLSESASTRRSGEVFDDLDVLSQGVRVVTPVPGDAIVALDRWRQRPEGHSGMGQAFDVLASQCDSQAVGDERHEGGFQLGLLKNSRRKAGRLAGFAEPVTKARMRL